MPSASVFSACRSGLKHFPWLALYPVQARGCNPLHPPPAGFDSILLTPLPLKLAPAKATSVTVNTRYFWYSVCFRYICFGVLTDVLNLSAMILCHFSLEYPRFRYFLGYFIDLLSLTPIHRRFTANLAY